MVGSGEGIRLRGVDLVLTYDCSGRCAHCCYRAGPGLGRTMTLPNVKRYLAELDGLTLQWILLLGGEPFLYPELLRHTVTLASRLAHVLIFTNGYWAIDSRTAHRRLAELQEVGQQHILFSVDAFHQAHVPLERVAIGVSAARELGFSQIEISASSLGELDADNAFNRGSRACLTRLAELCDLEGVTISRERLRMVGRAADEIGSHLPAKHVEAYTCSLPDYLGGSLLAPTGVEIHPDGWVNLCAGIALGNAMVRPLHQILASYDPETHPIIHVLAQEGPAGLRRLAEKFGYRRATRCVDGCHTCYEARCFLQPCFSDYLAPVQPYRSSKGERRP